MAANQFGIDVGQIVGARNAFADQQQRQQINALALQKGQMDLENAPALNALTLKSKQLEVSGAEQAQKLAAHNAEVKLVTDTLGALDGVPDEQLPQATAAAKAALVAQGAGTAALDQAVRESAGDPIKLRAALKMQAQQGLGYAAQLAQKNADRTFTAGRDDAKALADSKATDDKRLADTAKLDAANKPINADGTPNVNFQKYEKDKAAAAKTSANAGAFRNLTPAEAAAKGYKPGTRVQLNDNTGQERVIQAPTDTELKNAGYANRVVKADERLATLEKDGIAKPTAQILISEANGVTRVVASNQKDRQFIQASKEWLAPILRKDTGAAVTDSEFVYYSDIYIPRPEDGPEVLAQKKAARAVAIESLRAETGSAYGEMFPDKKPGADKSHSGPVQIKGDADFSALPSGTEFIAPDGSHRKKP